MLGLVFVGVVWGVTNPFLEQGVKDKPQQLLGIKGFLQTILDFKCFAPFAINQMASILYVRLLGQSPLSLAPILVNCVNTACTVVTESFLKKQPLTLRTLAGLFMLFLGICLIL